MGAAESHTAKKQVNVDEAKEFFSAKLVVGGDDKPETLLPISYWKEASEDEEATATFAYYCAVGRRVVSLAPSMIDGVEARRVPHAGTGRQVPGQVHVVAPAAGRRILRG